MTRYVHQEMNIMNNNKNKQPDFESTYKRCVLLLHAVSLI